MTKFKFERQEPDKSLEIVIERSAQKLKQLISERGFKVNSHVQEKIDSLVLKIEDKDKVKVSPEDILKKALEMINEEQGVLPEGLEKEYLDLVAEGVANEVAAGKDFYQVLGEKGAELKKQGIEINGEKIKKRAKELIRE